MITRDQMMPLLIEACPSFRGPGEEFLAYWADETEYLALAELASHLIDLLERHNTESVAGIFDVVERLHLDGDSYVREAATVGLLEDLQNLNLYKTAKPKQFEPFLGVESKRWWKKVQDFWEKRTLLTDN